MTSSTRHPAARAAVVAAALLALAVVVGAVTWADGVGGRTGAAGLLTTVVGAAAVLLLAGLAAAVLRIGLALREPGAPDALPLGRLGRLVAGLLVGAAGLAPQVAGAATPSAPVSLSSSTSAPGPASTSGDPVDPTYLGPTRPPAAPPHVGTASSRPQVPRATDQQVLVRPGDTLWGLTERSLRERFGPATAADDATVARAVLVVHAANRETVGPDPDLIRPGTRLALPDLTAALRPAGRSHR